jgi:8-amino-7-oxononanoate synthase
VSRLPADPPVIEGPEAARVVIDGTSYDWFRGSGYLGLQHHPDVLRAACDATLRYGLRLRDRRAAGAHPCLPAWERAATAFFDSDAAVLLGSGYAGGAVVAAALAGDVDVAFVDEQAHANIWDGLAAARLPAIAFAHRDPDALRAALVAGAARGRRALVMSDGVFPITGALAPVAAYRELLRAHEGAILCLDDAHGYGVLGANGRGTIEHLGMHDDGAVLSYGTMSKALGTGGGVIPCSAGLRERIEHRSAANRAMSKPSPGIVAAGTRALQIARTEPRLRTRLAQVVVRVRRALRSFGIEVQDSPAPIFCIPHAAGLDLAAVARRLHDRERIAVLHLDGGYANVPAGGCLAFTVSALHEDEQIDRLLAALRRAL